jgi:hypothetical protein
MTKPIRLYHTTTADRADSIMADGFRDNATVNRRLTQEIHYPPGVFFGDVPALDDELFDGVGLFNFDAEKQAFIAVDVRLPARRVQELTGLTIIKGDGTWPGVQYWAKAATWNEFPRVRLQLDDVIKLRLSAKPPLTTRMRGSLSTNMRRWIKEQDPRPYGTEFHARVKRILMETAAA